MLRSKWRLTKKISRAETAWPCIELASFPPIYWQPLRAGTESIPQRRSAVLAAGDWWITLFTCHVARPSVRPVRLLAKGVSRGKSVGSHRVGSQVNGPIALPKRAGRHLDTKEIGDSSPLSPLAPIGQPPRLSHRCCSDGLDDIYPHG